MVLSIKNRCSKQVNRWGIISSSFLSGMMFYLPILAMFYQECGFSYRMTLLVISFFGFTKFLFELPTGIIADRISLSLSVKLGYLFKFFYVLMVASVYFVQPYHLKLLIIIIATAVFAIGETLISGALSALLYHSVHEKKDFMKFSSYRPTAFAAGVVLSSLVSGVFYQISIVIPFLITAITFAGAFLISLTFNDIAAEKHKSYAAVLKGAIGNVRQSPTLILTFVLCSLLFALGMFFTWYAQLFYKNALMLDPRYYGLVNTFFVSVLMMGSGVMRYVMRSTRIENLILSIVLLEAVGFFAFFMLGGFNGLLIGGFLIYLAKGISIPVFSSAINYMIDDEKVRATVLSLQSVFMSAFYGIILVLISSVIESAGWILYFFVFLVTAIALLIALRIQTGVSQKVAMKLDGAPSSV